MALFRIFTGRWHRITDPQDDFEGKTVIVTGPSIGGLGFEAASKFAKLGAKKLILGARSTSSGEAAKREIEERHGTTGIEVWPLDMDSYDSIKAFAAKATALDHLDVVVLNAGVFMVAFKSSNYGWEETLQVNVLSTTLLALLLLPKLRQSGSDAVLEFVSSGRHTIITAESISPHLSDANLLQSYSDPSTYMADVQYRISKLFLMHVMQVLARKMKPPTATDARPPVVITSVCPGFCRSNLSRGHDGFLINLLRSFFFLFVRTQEQGARTLVSGASLGPEGHGQFWKDDHIQPPAAIFSGDNGEELRQRVWREVIEALEKDVPETGDLIKDLKV